MAAFLVSNNMAREFAGNFYKSSAWTKCREDYSKSVGGLCERCLSRGIIKAGVIVHHRIHLNENNITNIKLTLGWDNLELVCRDCHAEIHAGRDEPKRYEVDSDGRVRPSDIAPR